MESECAEFWQHADSVTEEEKKRSFELLARQKKVSPMVALAMLYLLYMEDKEYGRRCLSYLLLYGPSDKIVQYHNYQVLKTMNAAERMLFEEMLENFQTPLYPATCECATMNDELLAITRKSLLSSRGARTASCRSSGWNVLEPFAVQQRVSYADPVYYPQHEHIAAKDMTQTEECIAQLHAAVENIGRMLAHGVPVSRGRGYGRGRAQDSSSSRGRGRGRGTNRGRGGAAPWNYSGETAYYKEVPHY